MHTHALGASDRQVRVGHGDDELVAGQEQRHAGRPRRMEL